MGAQISGRSEFEVKHGPHGAKLTLLPLIAVIFFEVRHTPLCTFLHLPAPPCTSLHIPPCSQQTRERFLACYLPSGGAGVQQLIAAHHLCSLQSFPVVEPLSPLGCPLKGL